MKRSSPGRWTILIVAITAVFVAGWIRYHEWREAEWRDQCYQNILEIHEPMNCCIPMVNNLSIGAPLDPLEVVKYIKGGKLPKCPSGAKYQIQWFVGGAPPTCPYHGVLISKMEWDKKEAIRFEKWENKDKVKQSIESPPLAP